MYLKNSKIVAVKIGSSLLIDNNMKIRTKWLIEFSKDVKKLVDQGKKVIIITSGAIALGCKKLNLKKTNLKLDKSQAVASIGQIELMNLFKKNFKKVKLNLSQILLTLEDTEQRRRAINAKRTINNLFQLGFVPIVNENDSIATSEIKYGDNDRLAARVAQIIGADTLIIFSDVDGLYDKGNKKKLIKEVKNLSPSVYKLADKKNNSYGSGGMVTKLEAANICMNSGCYMFIGNGNRMNPIKYMIEKKIFTKFIPKISTMAARKKWIVSSLSSHGAILIDKGAANAIKNGKSLLAAGIKNVKGKFEKGENILISDEFDNKLARGLASFSSDEIMKIKGRQSSEIEKILGYVSKTEVIHKDDMVKL